MGGADAEHANQLIAHFMGELDEIGIGKRMQIARAGNPGQKLVHETSLFANDPSPPMLRMGASSSAFPCRRTRHPCPDRKGILAGA